MAMESTDADAEEAQIVENLHIESATEKITKRIVTAARRIHDATNQWP